MATYQLNVNGENREVEAVPNTPLLWVLRDNLNLTGTKYGCGMAQCGACTVHVDGASVRSCATPISTLGNKKITTIEGLDKDGQLHPLQQAFIEADAMQCGYCTSGMIMSGVALLKKNPKPSRDEIVKHMDRNVCRCGTYLRIVKAIELASGTSREVRK